jgi:hypothetical protein
LGLYIFRKAFEQSQMEYASGVAVLLFLITLAVASAYSLSLLRGEVADHVAAKQGQIGLLASDVIEGVPGGLMRLRAQLEGVPLGGA